MAKIAYKRFDRFPYKETKQKLRLAEGICDEYAAQGYSLTLRQLHYQFVSRGYAENNQKTYDGLQTAMKNGRLAGLIDWDHLVDRTRNVQSLPHADTPADYIKTAADAYYVDHWARQPTYTEVWIEKDALVGVIGPVCKRFDVPFFSCRGYTSLSEVWKAAQRILVMGKIGDGTAYKRIKIIHLGDHDPSGLDMRSSMGEYLDLFMAHHDGPDVKIESIALTMEQVRDYDLPPNLVKEKDSRSSGYRESHGGACWELDALPPTVISTLIHNALVPLIDDVDAWSEDDTRQAEGRGILKAIAGMMDGYTLNEDESDELP
jgi:hypothetical protein